MPSQGKEKHVAPQRDWDRQEKRPYLSLQENNTFHLPVKIKELAGVGRNGLKDGLKRDERSKLKVELSGM